MTNMAELDQLIQRVTERLNTAATNAAALQDELVRTKKLVEEKELDKIRALREKDRVIEELERDKMNLQKEKETLEAKIDQIAQTLKNILPDAVTERN